MSETDDPPEPPGGSHSTRVEVIIMPSAMPKAAALDEPWFRAKLAEAMRHVDAAPEAVTVSVVGDREMARLHAEHLGIPETTDVLTFVDAAPRPAPEADIAVCIDEAARQASVRGFALERELLLYAIHGILHCAGFDDRQPAEFEVIHGEEDRILRLIGVGETFGSREASS